MQACKFILKNSIAAFLFVAVYPAHACSDCEYHVCTPLGCACLAKGGCVEKAITKPVTDVITGASNAVNQGVSFTFTTISQATIDIAKTIKKAFDDTVRTVDITIGDINNNVQKAGSDTVAEVGRFGRGVETAGASLVKFAQSNVEGSIDSFATAERRVREGKVVDALWHQALDPIQVAEKSAGEAVLESEYLRTVGQVAASVYGGGPQGAAAYAAWLTYRQTGDPSLALRVGILTGASSAAFGKAQNIDGLAKKAIVTGAIGGAAVAAAGGNEQAVQEAFLRAGAMVVVQDGLKSYTKHALSPDGSKNEAYCISPESTNCTPLPAKAVAGTDQNGNFIVDMKEVDPSVPAVGLKDHTALFQESNPVMTAVSRIPGMQSMAIFHDTWAMDWNMGALATPATIMPAIVITYVGYGAPFYEHLRTTAVEKAFSEHSKILPIPTADPAGPKIVEYRVADSAVCFNKGELGTQVIQERVPDTAPLWCAKGGIIDGSTATLSQKKKIIAGGFKCVKKTLDESKGEKGIWSKYDCSQPLSLEDATSLIPSYYIEAGGTGGAAFTKSYPKEADYACRVIRVVGGNKTVEAASLTDRNYCASKYSQLVLSSVENEESCYSGDARK
jgi:hypothetical protein